MKQGISYEKIKVAVIGDAGVGKTAIIHHSVRPQPYQSIPLLVVSKYVYIADNSFELEIEDTGGGERFFYIDKSFYANAKCCILVYDLNNLKSFENLDYWREEVLKNCSFKTNNEMQFPFILVGNKSDVKGERQVTPQLVSEWCAKRGGIQAFETSAKDGHVNEPFYAAVKLVKSSELVTKEHVEVTLTNNTPTPSTTNFYLICGILVILLACGQIVLLSRQ